MGLRLTETRQVEQFFEAISDAKMMLQDVDCTLERWMTHASRSDNVAAFNSSRELLTNRTELMEQVRAAQLHAFADEGAG